MEKNEKKKKKWFVNISEYLHRTMGLWCVLSAMFVLELWTELEGKHYQYHYDKKNMVQIRS